LVLQWRTLKYIKSYNFNHNQIEPMIRTINILYNSDTDLLAVKNQVNSHPPEQVLIQVFSGKQDQDVVQKLVDQICEHFPSVALVGTSTAGEIMDARSLDEEILVSISLFDHSRVRSHLVTQNDDLVLAGHEIGEALCMKDTKALVVFGCGLKNKHTINGEPLLNAIQSRFSNAIIAGGQAGDNGKGEITFVFTQDGLTEHGVAGASISGIKLIAQNAYNLSWVPIGKKLTITEAQGPIVYSIDDMSPYAIYAHYLGQEVADGLPLSAADFPLIIERDGISMAIHATGVNEDGSFQYIHDFYPGEQLRFGFCHAGLLATGAQLTHEEVRSFKPQTIFVYSCVSRKWILGTDIAVELSSLEDIAPSSGFFCYGEYFSHESGRPYFFSQTMTVLSLSEGDSDKTAVTENEYDPRLEESRQFRTMRVLHRLVETSTREIESMNRELAKLASKDSLTGLVNRRLFDETFAREIKRQNRSGAPMSLLLVDIDFFKQFNDIYGHLHGDDCLRGISQLFAKVLKRPSDTVARYGGEEFACIMPATNHENALKLAEDVRSGIEALFLPHKGSEVSDRITVSIGVLTLSELIEVLPDELFKACDALLYKAKQNGRNRVEGGIFHK